MVAAKLANLQDGRPSRTTSIEAVSKNKAAELLNVSERSVERARFLQREGASESR